MHSCMYVCVNIQSTLLNLCTVFFFIFISYYCCLLTMNILILSLSYNCVMTALIFHQHDIHYI